MKLRTVWELARQTALEWNRHEGTRLGASLAFYAVLSLAPLVILAVALAGYVVGVEAAQEQVLLQFQALLGPAGANAVRSMINHAQNLHATSIVSVLGVLTLLFGASQVFSELQSALNKIWEVNSFKIGGILALVRQRFFSVGLVLAIGLLLLVSLLASAAIAAVGKFMGGALPLPEWILGAFDFALSVIGTSALFALIFHYMPDTRTRWIDSWIGGLVTALLFSLGKSLIGLYLGKASIGTEYGEAGSLVVVVVWVYYSSQIFYFGAELTHVLSEDRATRKRKASVPDARSRVLRPASIPRAAKQREVAK
jgi:membrane protein